MAFFNEVALDLPYVWWDTRQIVNGVQPDRSGNGIVGTVHGSPSIDTTLGATFGGVGSGQYIEGNGTLGPTTLSAFSFEVVINAIDLSNRPSVFFLDEATFTAQGGITANNDGNGDCSMFYTTAPSSSSGAISAASALTTGIDIHIVGEYNGTSAQVYINGVASGSPNTLSGFNLSLASKFILANDHSFSNGFHGRIRHGIFYTHALGPTRIAAHATAALNNDITVAHPPASVTPLGPTTQLTLKVPFQIDPNNGSVVSIFDPAVLAAQEIKTILMTMAGERTMAPQVGSPFSSHIFDSLTNTDSEYYTETMITALKSQVTLSTIQSTRFLSSRNDGTVTFYIEYTPNGYFQNVTTTVTLS